VPPADLERRCREFEARCRAHGYRLTPQRLAVYRALAADDSHPTADVVYERVRAVLPTLSQATVYRILESLERERLVRRVSTTGGVGRFDATLEPHQHLVCRVCGRMVDHFAPAVEGAPLRLGRIAGFVIEELDVRLVGRCAACAGSDPQPMSEVRSSGAAPGVRPRSHRASPTGPTRIRRRT
jgi:Fe2+ or Zn2+ uptake regulation protein